MLVFILIHDMRLSVCIFGLVVLLCIPMVAVSGAQEPQVASVHSHLMFSPDLEAAAEKYAARGNHAGAASYYTKAAARCAMQAEAQKRIGNDKGETKLLLEAAGLYAAAREQKRMPNGQSAMGTARLQSRALRVRLKDTEPLATGARRMP